MIFDTHHSPRWRHPLIRAATSGMTNPQHGYDPNQPRVPAGHSDGGQWTRIGGTGAPRNGLPPERLARLNRRYLPYGESAGTTDAYAFAGQGIDPGTAALHDRASMDALFDGPAGTGGARFQLLPLTDADPDTGWTPELDYVSSRGRGGRRYSPVEQLRIYQYNEALRNVRRYDPGFTEVSNPTSVPSQAAIARLEALSQGLARTHLYFETRGISLTPHALRSIAERPNRGITPETALRAYNTGRLFYDRARGYYIRRDSQTGIYVVVTRPRRGQIRSAVEGPILSRWIRVPYR